MRHLLLGVALAVAAIGPARAQALSPAATPPQWPWPQAAYAGASYPFPALTPWDAYRQGLINRWELERFEGPTPQALQGPSPDGGNQGGGDNRGGN